MKIVNCKFRVEFDFLVTNVPRLEKEIDEMVYALYGLTPEEIAIVEVKNK